ncbi:NlpC/P60 family protein [Ruegeria sediminis]|uniref:NlpC/P60 family protein n=1 Tax=Ruegeria sediminis TaxID=2583820 RepID=A0ABY2WWW9_9RHOB|nr:C40 family peptidase [Ruegeria sediminis]TMV06932.1 NlpC/P60 family protein [Ruegeria sediminis]
MTARRVIAPVVDLLRHPDGPRDRQLLFGDTVQVSEERDGWCRLIADKDGYPGWVRPDALGPVRRATHWVSAPATHVYERPDMKSPDRMSLSFGSRLSAISETGTFVETDAGFVPRPHVVEQGTVLPDPVAAAALFLGTPYLWGGNSRFGLDCSGLVQAALLACGIPCPGDSGDQERALGSALAPDTPPRRGDLMFWKGHVAWVADAGTLLHANAHHMAVQYEPLTEALARIEAQGDGPVTAHKRL